MIINMMEVIGTFEWDFHFIHFGCWMNSKLKIFLLNEMRKVFVFCDEKKKLSIFLFSVSSFVYNIFSSNFQLSLLLLSHRSILKEIEQKENSQFVQKKCHSSHFSLNYTPSWSKITWTFFLYVLLERRKYYRIKRKKETQKKQSTEGKCENNNTTRSNLEFFSLSTNQSQMQDIRRALRPLPYR